MTGFPAADSLAWRRFGPAFQRKCRDPRAFECARHACQVADACQHRVGDEGATTDAKASP
jgi:hypothetical protein